MNKLIKFVICLLSICIFISLGWWGSDTYKNYLNNKDLGLPAWTKPKPLEKYTIENLSRTKFKPSKININNNIFDFQVDNPPYGEVKKVTGLINLPETNGKSPIIILIRGYVDQSIYQTGDGTKRVGEYFKDKGYITLAPDFLGYGGSDSESANIFESRFQTYTTILTLLKSIEENPPQGWDKKNIFIWAHSNGGQIALIVLEVLGISNPDLIGATVLWAPVTEDFPYSILFYTNESDDRGKFIRHELSKFEEDYDTDKFSLTSYLDRINTPIEYHWGTNDDAISSEWRDRFIKQMKLLNKDFKNYNHPSADHNMNPLWGEVIYQGLNFFNSNLQKTSN
ncbi:MAG: alpha/beta hydrolase [Candidatus Woesebacteria bacterium]|nr:alpha/beta hydrolase [Candidatus Woesebacteria bacterium]